MYTNPSTADRSLPAPVPNLTFYAESGSHGPGWNSAARNRSLETILTKKQAAQWSIERVFGGKPAWIDWDTVAALK